MQTTNPHPRSRNFAQDFPGWVEQYDANYHAWFYVNKATGQSQWTQYVSFPTLGLRVADAVW